ncbi:H-NS family nucleoid-associated regulatory protein [Paraburkholderia bannensis]|uniref:H-NS family nucleoid-associated regulatory protein n=1 Tax=Paraburkholderia bannensis TaxID=765414 RepID=UPI002AC3337E|nr:H-NS family nucleoid-associated regulatory protein [Paraburkholderia bannensis]
MATLESINAKIAKLKAQAESLVVKKSTAVLDKIRGLMEQHGIGVSDIEAHVGKRRGRKPGAAAAKRSASVAKYADPKTGATWTGHGRAPAWIANAKDRSTFLVEGASPSVAAPAKAAKAGNYRRGPQPALYADPKTGATWSGRGRAPAWIASAKDRAKFLIAEAGGAAETLKAKPTKKVVSEKKAAPAKKAPAKKTGGDAENAMVAKKAAVSTKAPAKKAAKKSATTAAKNLTAKKSASKRPVAKKVVANEAVSPEIGSVVAVQTASSATPTAA